MTNLLISLYDMRSGAGSDPSSAIDSGGATGGGLSDKSSWPLTNLRDIAAKNASAVRRRSSHASLDSLGSIRLRKDSDSGSIRLRKDSDSGASAMRRLRKDSDSGGGGMRMRTSRSSTTSRSPASRSGRSPASLSPASRKSLTPASMSPLSRSPTPAGLIRPGDDCCRNADDSDSDSLCMLINELKGPRIRLRETVLAPPEFRQLILALLESIVLHHGSSAASASGAAIDQLVLKFALDRSLDPAGGRSAGVGELRRILRLVLRCVVSMTSRSKSEPVLAEQVIQRWIRLSWSSRSPVLGVDAVRGFTEVLLAMSAGFRTPADVERFCSLNALLDALLRPETMELLAWLSSSGCDMDWLTDLAALANNVMDAQRMVVSSGCRRKRSKHHHGDVCGRPPDGAALTPATCVVSRLFQLLLAVYVAGDPESQAVALEAMVLCRSPCCCTPAGVIYEALFRDMLPDSNLLLVLERVGLCCCIRVRGSLMTFIK